LRPCGIHESGANRRRRRPRGTVPRAEIAAPRGIPQEREILRAEAMPRAQKATSTKDRRPALKRATPPRVVKARPQSDIAHAGGHTRGIDRAFEILECLHDSKKPLRPNEIAVAIGAPKSTTYDVVGLMLSRGILDRADAEGRVFLGRRLYLFGLSHLTHFDVMRLASGYLDHLSEVT